MKDIRSTLDWLYGGNYERNQMDGFNEVIKNFANQCFVEQKYLLEVCNHIHSGFEHEIYEDDEVLEEIDRVLMEDEDE